MKVFISQPMNGKSEKEINERREEIIQIIENRYLNKHIEFIYSIIDSEPNNDVENIPVWYLGESIKKLSTATLAYFDSGWQKARGCRIEHQICKDYNIPIFYFWN